MNTSRASTGSADHIESNTNDETYAAPGEAEIRCLDSSSRALHRGARPFGNSHRYESAQLDHSKREELPTWKERVPLITLKPRARHPVATRPCRHSRPIKAALFVPSLADNDDIDHISESSPVTFVINSVSMTMTRKPSMATNDLPALAHRPFTPAHRPLEEGDAHPVTNSIKRKRSLQELSPFLSIEESTSFSRQTMDPVNVEKEHKGSICRDGSFTPTERVILISKPHPVRQRHQPRSPEDMVDSSPSVKPTTTIELSASSAFSLTS